jgi:hypothetical protein
LFLSIVPDEDLSDLWAVGDKTQVQGKIMHDFFHCASLQYVGTSGWAQIRFHGDIRCSSLLMNLLNELDVDKAAALPFVIQTTDRKL